ncbi:hypothetical protein AVEN_135778-1 [Araneus ventricosus]|uniref:Uncharacterized protein n=1 Tax=Araneus ventricosus TaxID=182803 RepID=A0A4Y2CA86_ARAVE|nr:hypothetical protein AVEN_135778-1 [Araneus ventricosus]
MLLDVSMCLAVWSNEMGSISIRRFCVQNTCFRPTTSYNTCRRPFSSSFGPKEKKHYCAAARCRPLCSIREENLRYYGAKKAFTMQVSMQGDQLCVSPSTDDREGPAYVGQKNTFPAPDSNWLLYSSQTSPDSHWRAIQDV